jgi:hypothetical protein
MGQEERKNKAKLEKTQINLASTNTEYENAVKVLEETTGRWNRDWKAAADKFQDLEEERLDFMKSSLWSFANISSTVCVSDDASCEKVRLSLENCEVEKDIISFIKERGTGQEIPDPPKYINFRRGDVDSQSETSEDEHYSVAQFQRTINPAYRSSSPQPSTYESHHDPQPTPNRDPGHEPQIPPSREPIREPIREPTHEPTPTPQKVTPTDRSRQPQLDYQQQPSRRQYEQSQHEPLREPIREPTREPIREPIREPTREPSREPALTPQKVTPTERSRQPQLDYQQQPSRLQYEQSQHRPLSAVPHDPHPMDGMTMLCRTGPPSERSSAPSLARPSSRDSNSEYSNPTSFSSQEPPSGKVSPVKQPSPEKQVLKKKSGFFQSPFRRKSIKEKDNPTAAMTPSSRNTWSARSTTNNQSSPARPQMYGQGRQGSQNMMISDRPTGSPEPVDPRASFQLNVGNNVFDVATPDNKSKAIQNTSSQPEEELDPIAQALAELKGVTKASSTRVSADNYHGIPTPAPGATPNPRPVGAQMANGALTAGMRGTPPPSYDQPMQRLGLPQPAFTSKAMQQTRQKYVDQTQNMFNAQARPESQGGYGSGSRPGTRNSDMPRATSPAPQRSVSPRPSMQSDSRQSYRSASPNPYGGSQGSASPNPYGGSQRSRTQSTVSSHQKRGSDQGYYRHNSPGEVARAVSPAPFREQQRPSSGYMNNEMAMQLAASPEDHYGSQSSRRSGTGSIARPMSSYYGSQAGQVGSARQRSKSVADVRQFTRDGRPILHFGKSSFIPKFHYMLTLLSSCTLHVPGRNPRGAEFRQGRYPGDSQTSR